MTSNPPIRRPPTNTGLAPLAASYTTGAPSRPLSAGVNVSVSASTYVPSATTTRTAPPRGSRALSRRTASRAPFNDATGPSVRAAFGSANRPDQLSLPPGATWNVASAPHTAPTARAMAVYVVIIFVIASLQAEWDDYR